MKKALIMIEDNIEIILNISNVDIDVAATQTKMDEYLKNHPGTTESEELFNELAVDSKYGPEYKIFSDEEGSSLDIKLKGLNEHEKLASDGSIIPDWKGTEYWIYNGKWEKEKIENIEVPLPEDAILDDALTQDQRKEIFDQQENERLDNLSPEERSRERVMKIDNELQRIDRNAGAGRAVRELLLEFARSSGIIGAAVENLETAETEAGILRQERNELS